MEGPKNSGRDNEIESEQNKSEKEETTNEKTTDGRKKHPKMFAESPKSPKLSNPNASSAVKNRLKALRERAKFRPTRKGSETLLRMIERASESEESDEEKQESEKNKKESINCNDNDERESLRLTVSDMSDTVNNNDNNDNSENQENVNKSNKRISVKERALSAFAEKAAIETAQSENRNSLSVSKFYVYMLCYCGVACVFCMK